MTLSLRAVDALGILRTARASQVAREGTVVSRDEDVSWWTRAGARANATLASALTAVSDPDHGYDNHRVRLRPDVTRHNLALAFAALGDIADVRPEVTEDAVRGLKFLTSYQPTLPGRRSHFGWPTTNRGSKSSQNRDTGRSEKSHLGRI